MNEPSSKPTPTAPTNLLRRTLLLAGLIVATLLVVRAIWMGGMYPASADPPCDPELERLLLKPSLFADQVATTLPRSDPALRISVGPGTRACEVSYSGTYSHSSQAIYRVNDLESAALAFMQLSEGAFSYRPEFDLPWSETILTPAMNIRADRFEIKCTPRMGLVPRCAAVAQYGLLLSVYDSEIDSHIMTQDAFANLVFANDQTMQSAGKALTP